MNENPCPQYAAPSITLGNYDALVKKIGSGALEVQYDGKKVVYRSLEDMMKIERWFYAILFPSTAPSSMFRVGTYFDSGFNSFSEYENEEFRR